MRGAVSGLSPVEGVRDADGDRYVDVVLGRITANECNAAAEELARCLDTALPVTEDLLTARELLAAFLDDLNNECLARWGYQGQSRQPNRSSEPHS
jgi:hypothetical protein